MKRLMLATIGMLALAATAKAADLPRRYEPVPQRAPAFMPVYNWTGLYIGINGGGAWGRSSWDSTDRFNIDGGMVGGTIGYNWQNGPAVFGIETDLSWSDIHGRSHAAVCPDGCKTTNSWLGTTRGRLGYAIDRWMPYVTGGVAYGDIKGSVPGLAGNSDTSVGWTVGAGVEFALPGNWTAKGEYLYVDLANSNFVITGASNGYRFGLIRAGVNYRF